MSAGSPARRIDGAGEAWTPGPAGAPPTPTAPEAVAAPEAVGVPEVVGVPEALGAPEVLGARPGPVVGTRVVHRRYVGHSHAHYAGNLVDGAYVLALFGDVATELCIRTDGDEGLFASYSEVRFHAPLRGGDVVEVAAALVRVGRRSREMAFTAHVTCRGAPQRGASAADALEVPILITSARGTVVVP